MARPSGRGGDFPPSNTFGGIRTPALKEWRSVCRSIFKGEQIITLRKGGIREDERRFEVRYQRFVLFPTYEHQAHDYLKPAYSRFAEVEHEIDSLPEPSKRHVVIEGFCDVAGVFKVTDERILDAIDSMHIWQKAYVLERLKWKPRQPLYVVALRTHIFPAPVKVPVLESYAGCKSWIELEAEISMDGDPVLSETAFGAKLSSLKQALT